MGASLIGIKLIIEIKSKYYENAENINDRGCLIHSLHSS